MKPSVGDMFCGCDLIVSFHGERWRDEEKGNMKKYYAGCFHIKGGLVLLVLVTVMCDLICTLMCYHVLSTSNQLEDSSNNHLGDKLIASL